ncbi:MAG: RluA family pseudouridine synthase [Myxococcales bacterium]|nr:RluA family pseudouridine synthase [Myxococcales bacterium]
MERRRPGERQTDTRRDSRDRVFDSRAHDPRLDPRNPGSGGMRRPGDSLASMPLIPLGPPGKPDIPPPPPKPVRVPDPIAQPGTSHVRQEEERQALEREQGKQRRREEVLPVVARKRKGKLDKEPKLSANQICRIVHVDDAVIVVDKMAGVPVAPARGFRQRSVVHALHTLGYLTVYPISLLDMEASGLVLFSRSESAAQALRWNWRSRLCVRNYVAVLTGDLTGNKGKISVATGAVPHGTSIRHQALPVESGGRTGTTEWQLLGRGRGMTRVLCSLHTGRCHQIRIHFATIGYPVVGDKVYGAVHNEVPLEVLIDLPGRRSEGPKIAQGTVALHCSRIRMPHPTSQQPMDWQAPVPRRLTALMA